MMTRKRGEDFILTGPKDQEKERRKGRGGKESRMGVLVWKQDMSDGIRRFQNDGGGSGSSEKEGARKREREEKKFSE